MKNADLPAYPIFDDTGDVSSTMSSLSGGGMGLTKREYFAVHMNLNTKEYQFEDDAFEEFIGRKVDFDDVEDTIKASFEAESKIRRMRADAMLAELGD